MRLSIELSEHVRKIQQQRGNAALPMGGYKGSEGLAGSAMASSPIPRVTDTHNKNETSLITCTMQD